MILSDIIRCSVCALVCTGHAWLLNRLPSLRIDLNSAVSLQTVSFLRQGITFPFPTSVLLGYRSLLMYILDPYTHSEIFAEQLGNLQAFKSKH